MANATIHELRGEITNQKDALCILKIEMEDLKNIVSARKSEIEKLEESLQKMTDAEEQARDSCNAGSHSHLLTLTDCDKVTHAEERVHLTPSACVCFCV
jgi:predicted  nucleic acid-binding Zn-ribbon protein